VRAWPVEMFEDGCVDAADLFKGIAQNGESLLV
jgi:hypothetical protein